MNRNTQINHCLFIVLFSVALLFTGCAKILYPYHKDLSTIKIGMNQEQLIQKIGKPGNVVSSKKYEDGVLEIYEYITDLGSNDTLKKTWFFFFNNELQEWGPKENYTDNYERYYEHYRRGPRP